MEAISSIKGKQYIDIIAQYQMKESYHRANCKKVLPVLKKGMESTDPMIKKLCDTVNRVLHVMEDEEYYPYYENEEMRKYDKKPKVTASKGKGKGAKGVGKGGRATVSAKSSTAATKKKGGM